MNPSNTGNPSVIIRLRAGLGNQLFMYAFAQALALKNDMHLKMDKLSGFSNDKTYNRKYLLQHFNIDDETASVWESFHHAWGERRRRFVKRWNRMLPLRMRRYVAERERIFDREIFDLSISKDTYFDGYWQSYKYFEEIEDIIRKKFAVRFELTEEIEKEAGMIRSVNAVCLGIRRFADVPLKRRNRKTIMESDYFRKAVSIMESAVSDPVFFVFTQDRPWVQQHLPMDEDRFIFVSEKDPDLGAVKDLWLMTQCRHYVISNSTLHWWGAWLNNNQDKLVIAPEHGWGNRDILPPQWRTIGTKEP
jgi:hypothetical protein